MKTILKRVAALMILTVLMITLGCATSKKDKLVGKWSNTETKETVVLVKDGTMQLIDGNATVGGTWSVLEDGRLKLDISMSGVTTSQIYKVAFNGTGMSTIDEKNSKDNFTRI